MAARLTRFSTRFKTLKEFDAVRRAAKLSGLSINEFLLRAAAESARKINDAKPVTNSVIDNNPEAA